MTSLISLNGSILSFEVFSVLDWGAFAERKTALDLIRDAESDLDTKSDSNWSVEPAVVSSISAESDFPCETDVES